jgi:cell division protein FtsW
MIALTARNFEITAVHVYRDYLQNVDRMLLGISLILLAIGIVMVSSASIEVAEANSGNPFYHIIRHLIYAAIGMIVAILVFSVPTDFWEKSGWVLLVCALILLTLVVVPGIGREVNGSMRWIPLGPISIQASEPAKLFVVIYLASYLVRRLHEVRSQWSGFLKPMSVLALMIMLMLLEPDMGAVVVMLIAVLGMMFLGGVKLGQFVVLIAVSLSAVVLMAISQPYRMQRLVTFMDPWAEENVFDSGYQLTQALIAFGRGEWFGVGLGNSVQKLFYLPEAHTDFVFAILAEEFGLIGSLVVVALFIALIFRIMRIGHKAELSGRFFSAYLAYGIALLFSAQALINMGVNTGLLPTKGLTLPLLSYGGSSLVVCFVSLAMVLRVGYETDACQVQQQDKKVRSGRSIKGNGKPKKLSGSRAQ